MIEKVGPIKNPLTIIAIFAGIAEISGTAVLPFISQDNQAMYIWFLMIFPILLVSVFFLTLNFNHSVLYAPSDFREDKHFLDLADERQSKAWEPFDRTPLNQPLIVADLQTNIDAGKFDAAYKEIEAVSDIKLRGRQYKELAKICMARQDRSNSIRAVQKYQELRGDTPDVYRLLGYTYWWFKELDTAIAHAEKGLSLAISQNDTEEIKALKNSLAYYYADKGINKEQAFSYSAESLSNLIEQDPSYPMRLDTNGYVYLKFGNSPDEMNTAIDSFTKALKFAPGKEYAIEILEHLKQALDKKVSLLVSSA